MSEEVDPAEFSMIALSADFDAVEWARDHVKKEHLPFLVNTYDSLLNWEQKACLIMIVMDHDDQCLAPIMRDYLRAPSKPQSDSGVAKAAALCFFDGNNDGFGVYFENQEAADGRAQEILEEGKEVSPGGSTIERHTAQQPSAGQAVQADDERICAHIETYVGPLGSVFHELVSDRVHVDVHVVQPTDKRPWITLITAGMSAMPMTVPEGAEEFRFGELCVCLPPDWPLGDEAFEDERNYWPVRLLKSLARLPHDYGTWLGHGHTIPNGDPAKPFAAGTQLAGALVMRPPASLGWGFHELQSGEKTVLFYLVTALYADEMDYKLGHGVDSLLERLVAQPGAVAPIDVSRPSVVSN